MAAAREWKKTNPRLRLTISVGLALTVYSLYAIRPDWAQAVHWWSMAFWTPIVFLPLLSFRFRALFVPSVLALLGWLALLHLIGEPAATIVLPRSAKASGDYRIVSLNCAAGTVDAAREAFSQSADIVLLQEVGTQREFVRAAQQMGYPYVSWSIDDAVFTRVPIIEPSKAIDFAAGTIFLGQKQIRLLALRLNPPVFRLDLWNPECWQAYADDVRARRTRFKEILGKSETSGICLMGGDFNATNPRIVTDNNSEFKEASRTAGRGWYGTGTNDYPFAGVDQIWSSANIRWTQSWVQKTVNSDHRMVIADFSLAR